MKMQRLCLIPICLLLTSLQSLCAIFPPPTNPPALVTVSWDPVPDPTVVGYNFYFGDGSRAYTNMMAVGSVTNYTVTLPARGLTFYFAVTAYTGSGLESDYSQEASYKPASIPAAPNLHPLAVLHVQSAPSPVGIFADTPMDWALPIESTNQVYRLKLAWAQATVSPQTKATLGLRKAMAPKLPPPPQAHQ